VAQPLLFTVAFRKKMAQLSQSDRREWLASIAVRYRRSPTSGLEQELREVARGCRLPLRDAIQGQLGPFDPAHLDALVEVPRDRFVRPEDLERSSDDTPLPLDDAGLATISAPHAYLLSFRLLELTQGDVLVELGTGSGYGAALAANIVGASGRVRTFEIDEALVRWAERDLAGSPTVEVRHRDAIVSADDWEGAGKIVTTFAIDAIPKAWLDALPEGGRLVAPVGASEGDQRLVVVRRERGRVVERDAGAVRYVRNRSSR
jgi:protein-L-isoaspartate(D-aspartate) O-methyltransferase